MYVEPKYVQAGLGAVIAQLEQNAAHLRVLADEYDQQADAQARIMRDAQMECHRLVELAKQRRSEGLASLVEAKKLYEVKNA